MRFSYTYKGITFFTYLHAYLQLVSTSFFVYPTFILLPWPSQIFYVLSSYHRQEHIHDTIFLHHKIGTELLLEYKHKIDEWA